MTQAFVVVAALASSTVAHADSDTHYQDTLIGDRAAGMGGAFTARANEATGAITTPPASWWTSRR